MAVAAMSASPRVLLPVKRFDQAKSRLAPVLNAAERAALARAMFQDVLSALMAARGISAAVVTADENAGKMASEAGAAVLADRAENGVNAAISFGIDALIRNHASAVIVVPADLPSLTAEDIENAAAQLATPSVILARAGRDGGTNLFANSPPGLIPTLFGAGSFFKHVQASLQAGVKPKILHLKNLCRDVDLPEDLSALTAGPAVTGTYTSALLRELQLNGRRPRLERICEGETALRRPLP